MIFLLARICEIGGGYLVWLWLEENKPYWDGILGTHILAFLWCDIDLANFQFWTCLRYLWRNIHCAFPAMGMES